MEKEIWKPVVGYENYEVSNTGKVRSLNYMNTGKVKELCVKDNGHGYLLVQLGRKNFFYVHRLVAQAFIPNPDNLPQVNHKNYVKSDNRVENLEFCSAKYNMEYSNVVEKAAESHRKPVLQFTKDGEFVKEYESVREAESQTGIKTICKCCKGHKDYPHAGGFIWKYKNVGGKL